MRKIVFAILGMLVIDGASAACREHVIVRGQELKGIAVSCGFTSWVELAQACNTQHIDDKANYNNSRITVIRNGNSVSVSPTLWAGDKIQIPENCNPGGGGGAASTKTIVFVNGSNIVTTKTCTVGSARVDMPPNPDPSNGRPWLGWKLPANGNNYTQFLTCNTTNFPAAETRMVATWGGATPVVPVVQPVVPAAAGCANKDVSIGCCRTHGGANFVTGSGSEGDIISHQDVINIGEGKWVYRKEPSADSPKYPQNCIKIETVDIAWAQCKLGLPYDVSLQSAVRTQGCTNPPAGTGGGQNIVNPVEKTEIQKIKERWDPLAAHTDGKWKDSWKKEKDGTFNTNKLLIDAAGGTIVGAGAGILTNVLMKNAQLKSGYENIQCVSGSGATAAYGEQFILR